MKMILTGMLLIIVVVLGACSSTPPQTGYGDRPLTAVNPPGKGPRIYARTNIWKIQQKQEEEAMRWNALKNLEKRMGHWQSINDRVAWQNSVTAQRAEEKKIRDRQRFLGFF